MHNKKGSAHSPFCLLWLALHIVVIRDFSKAFFRHAPQRKKPSRGLEGIASLRSVIQRKKPSRDGYFSTVLVCFIFLRYKKDCVDF